ncbi:MAG: hypothetical protein ACBR23_21690 [Microcoleus sp.]
MFVAIESLNLTVLPRSGYVRFFGDYDGCSGKERIGEWFGVLGAVAVSPRPARVGDKW